VSDPVTNRASQLCASLRSLRRAYDALPRGDVAVLRRCRTSDDVAVEGAFWRIARSVTPRQAHLAHVVLLFPFAGHSEREGFSFGRLLHRELGDDAGAALRFRRVVESRDRDELDHRLRGLLRLACGGGAPVDWGVLGVDILWFFAESGAVRRRWAQDFYAPSARRIDAAASSHS
jgi:CRISPR type I-E-associated protein CasB/Cse2